MQVRHTFVSFCWKHFMYWWFCCFVFKVLEPCIFIINYSLTGIASIQCWTCDPRALKSQHLKKVIVFHYYRDFTTGISPYKIKQCYIPNIMNQLIGIILNVPISQQFVNSYILSSRTSHCRPILLNAYFG